MTAIYKRELKAYFHSMIGYVFIAFLIAFTGVYFMMYNLNYGYPYFAYTLSGIMFVFMVAVPVLTMRSFAEDRKNKTDQLLITSPVSIFSMVMGKFLSMITILAIPCVVFLLFPLIIKAQGTAHIGVDYLAILVFFLLGCVYISIGMFISSLTQSQIIAAIGTFGILLALNLLSGVSSMLPTAAWMNAVAIAVILSLVVAAIWHMTQSWPLCAGLEIVIIAGSIIIYAVKKSVYESALANMIGKLKLTDTFESISSNSLLDISGLIMYLSIIGLFVFLTMQMIQKRRWS